MPVIDNLASTRGEKGDDANIELAEKIVLDKDESSVKELTEILGHKDKSLQSDSIKTLYEIGYRAPGLIKEYWKIFYNQVFSKNNRLVWGGMIALSTVAFDNAENLFPFKNRLFEIIEKGSVITQDAGIRVMAGIIKGKKDGEDQIVRQVLELMENMEVKYLPQRLEAVIPVLSKKNKELFKNMLESRLPYFSQSQLKRICKLFPELKNRA